MECFHNLAVDVINEETKALHHSAHLFYEKKEVKETLHLLLNKCTTGKDFSRLKIGKLSRIPNQKIPSYRLQIEGDPDVEHSFVEISVSSLS